VRLTKWVVALGAVVAMAALASWQLRPARGESQADIRSGKGSTAIAASRASAERKQELALWQMRYMRAEQVYNTYRDATRYPPESRPAAEHPDQVWPFEPIRKDVLLQRSSGNPAKSVRIQATQERLFLAGADSVKFTITAVNEDGGTVPLVVERSMAQSLPVPNALVTVVRAEVPFADDGTAPDGLAGDGEYSARLTPAAQGFANHSGTIRLSVEINADGQKGVVPFEVVYTPAVPATWAGVREALQDGSLNFYLQADVKTPGRYVASARVYDASGFPVALLLFDGFVAAPGLAEFKLSLAGVLVRDKNPTFPLRLVDVEGFLLRPGTFPDRAMMPRLAGEVHVGERYNLDSFSGEEWQSPERAQHLAQYAGDVQRAFEKLGKLGQKQASM